LAASITGPGGAGVLPVYQQARPASGALRAQVDKLAGNLR